MTTPTSPPPPSPGSCPRRSTSTTRPCATAASRKGCRSPSTTSCGWPSSSTISACSTSRAAGRGPIPRTRSSSGGRRPVSCTCTTPPWWRSARPARPAAGPRPTRCSPISLAARTPAVCLVAKSAECHVTETLRTSLTEAVDMVADSVAFLRRAGAAGLPRRRALLRRLPANPGFSLDVLRAAGARRRRGARAVRHQRRQPALRGGARSSARSATPVGHHARLPLPQRLRLRGGQLAGRPSARACTQVQGCINGYGERTGNADLCATVPNLVAQDGGPHHRRRPPGAAHPGLPPHRRAGQHRPRPPPALRRRLGLRPQGRAAHQRHRPVPRRLRARRARLGRQRHPLRGERDGRPLDHRSSRRTSSASTSTAPVLADVRREAQATSSTAATTSRWPTARSSCSCGPPPDGSSRSSGSSPSGSSPSSARTARSSPRRPSRSTSATSGCSPRPRATARSTPSTPPCARRSARAIPSSPTSTSPTTRSGCSTPPRAPARSPGC